MDFCLAFALGYVLSVQVYHWRSGGSPQLRQYGEWSSPITAKSLVSSSIRLGAPSVHLDLTGAAHVFWLEARPLQQGRQVLVRYSVTDGQQSDVTPDGDWNVRTTVHEYGGGDYLIANGKVFFSNFKDQGLWQQSAFTPSDPVRLTPAGAQLRFANCHLDAVRSRLICVMEDHSKAPEQPQNSIAAIPLDAAVEPAAPEVLVSGSDFFASPVLSPDGNFLAWIRWNHPNMPWDGTELCIAPVTKEGRVGKARVVAGGPKESVTDPLFASNGDLYFVSDRGSGWWNVHKSAAGGGAVEAVLPKAMEFVTPMWQMRGQQFHVLPDGTLLCVATDPQVGSPQVYHANPSDQSMNALDLRISDKGMVVAWAEGPNGVVAACLSGSAVEPARLLVGQYPSVADFLEAPSGSWREVKRSVTRAVNPGYLSVPTPIVFPTTGGRTAWAIFYPPTNKDFVAPFGSKPPLLVRVHGGPTHAASTAYNLQIQYWTSRGFAVADVNYGGSTGYGREYRERLKGNWGVVDVDDATNLALYLSNTGTVNRDQLCIDGGSAGGYTTLAALAFRDVFKAGASHFGVSDLTALAAETHKFESRYFDGLVGPYPQEKSKYEKLSPINSVDQIQCPLVLFQGLEDKIVPPNQAEMMFDKMKAKGLATALLLFEGEQHGFRKAANIQRAVDGEYQFYAQVFGWKVPVKENIVVMGQKVQY